MRVRLHLTVLATLAAVGTTTPAWAANSTASVRVTTRAGGMVSGPATASSALPAVDAGFPSCRSVRFGGDSGVIAVHAINRTVAWGIQMYNAKDSIGRWDVNTFLNNKKQSSGFHKTLTGPYVPHGSLPNVRPGRHFSVTATLVVKDGRSFHNVTNSCIVP